MSVPKKRRSVWKLVVSHLLHFLFQERCETREIQNVGRERGSIILWKDLQSHIEEDIARDVVVVLLIA